MEALKTFLIALHLLITVILIVVVLMQESKNGGLSQTISGNDTETFFGKNSGGTYESIMRRWTAVAAVMFLITSFALTLLLK